MQATVPNTSTYSTLRKVGWKIDATTLGSKLELRAAFELPAVVQFIAFATVRVDI